MNTMKIIHILILCAALAGSGCLAGESPSGGFTEWSSWSNCSITCGLGNVSRSRECQLDNGGFCNGTTVEMKVCFKTVCTIPPIWTTWSAWTECSGTCGSGNRTRQRTCTNLFSCPQSMEVEACFSGCRLPLCPAKGDDFDCNFETQCWLADDSKRWVIGKNTPSENTGPDVDHTFLSGCGHFAYFEASCLKKGDAGSLSTSIKIATISQYCFSFWVSMYSVYPKQMGVLNLYFIQSQKTPTQLWSAHTVLTNSTYTWKRISMSLNVTIGEGFYMIFEAIRGSGFNSDMAIDDGKLTEGECKGQVDGHWGNWQQWTSCVVTCGSGIQRRNRTCTAPAPANDGLNCVGLATVTKSCQHKKECPVNGGWCDWSTWSSCLTTCDNSTRYRMRECSEPAPMHGGSQCVKFNGNNGLEEVQVESCYNEPCFRLGGWSEWSNVTECSVTCGSGTVTRKRRCNNPTPLGEASLCINSKNVPSLEEIESLGCYYSCPVTPGTWWSWSIWSNCDKTCGNGTQTRNRTCSPINDVCELTNGSYGEQDFEGRECFSMACNINGGWGPWVTITGCSANCGGGVYTQERDCNSPEPKGLGNPCEFSTYDGHGLHENRTVSCNTEPCIEVSIWGEWTTWSSCFPNCAYGHKHRNRTCIFLADSIGCLINGTHSMTESEMEACSIATCPVNGSWSQWSSWSGCLKTCDNGTRYRTRQCSSPAPKHGGVKCKKIDGTLAVEEVGLKYCHNDPCFRFGGWSKWRNVTECSATCGIGTFLRKRYCNNPTPIGQGGLCIDMNNKPVLHEVNTVGCSLGACPANGAWSSWSTWTRCDKTCDNGTQCRNRSCIANPLLLGGNECHLANGSIGRYEIETQSCFTKKCPAVSTWGTWSFWSSCFPSCDNGTQYRNRTCKAVDGTGCILTNRSIDFYELVIRTCYQMVCPVNGGWGPWHNLTECSVTCGKGYYHQKRLCNDPPPKGKGKECQLITTDEYGLCENRTLACNCQPCPVIGMWSTWNSWSECSVTCDVGQARRNRTCNNTLELYGNVECLLSDNISLATYETQTRDCGGNSCPIHGEWGSWTETECSTSCGNGNFNRSRKCNNPEPQFGGRNCLKTDNTSSLEEFVTDSCNLRPCPIHGEWGSWTETECSTSCGNGNINRSRECNDPEPQFGGQNCLKTDNTSSLEEFTTDSCNLRPCPIHGKWGAWSSWTTCDKTCGQSLKRRNRTCDSPSPQFGGMECLLTNGTRSQEENAVHACFEMVCPVNGKWGPWKNETDCSSTCGGGFYTQERVCDSPAPVGLGNPCEFITYDGYGLFENRTFACNTQFCPVHGGWSSWESWSSCSKSCDIGFKRRKRSCNSPEPLFGGEECLLSNSVDTGLSESQTSQCRLRDCPIDGEWGSWTNTPCSVTCGGGELRRTRHCNNPPPQFGGMCVTNDGDRMFNESLTESCNNEPCPVNGSWAVWSTWTSCSHTCGTGVRHRNRLCNNPLPVANGLECLKKDGAYNKSEEESESCFIMTCLGPHDCTFENASYTKTLCQFLLGPGLNRWQLITGATPTINTGPYYDHTYGDSRGYYLYFESSHTVPNLPQAYPSDESYFTLQNLPPFSGPRCMTFWLHMFQNTTLRFVDPGEFRVEQTIGTQPPIEKLKHTDELHINDWVQQKIDLDQSPTDTYEIRFYARRGSFAGDRGVDDVFFYSSSCADIPMS